MKRHAQLSLLFSALALMNAQASTLWVGNDTVGPVVRYTSAGALIGPWGASGATGSALDGAGHVYTVVPSGVDSVITKYDCVETPVGTIHFTSGGGSTPGLNSWIEDMTYGGGDTLWVSGYNGMVYHIDSTGAVLSSFDTGHFFVGVATDGSFLYTTVGFDGGGVISKRDFTGAVVDTIATGYSGAMGGIGYDASDSTLWVGDFNIVNHFSLAGALLGSIDPAGGSFHDGLEVGELDCHGVPDSSSTLLLLGLGLLPMSVLLRKTRFA